MQYSMEEGGKGQARWWVRMEGTGRQAGRGVQKAARVKVWGVQEKGKGRHKAAGAGMCV